MFRQKLQNFMRDRYGVDQFNRFLLIISAVIMFITFFINNGRLYLLALILLGYSYFRMLSRNYGNRALENQKYLQITDRIRYFFRVQKERFEQRKIYKFYTCKSCKQKVRVPRGKGKIEITCPKCKNKFIKRT